MQGRSWVVRVGGILVAGLATASGAGCASSGRGLAGRGDAGGSEATSRTWAGALFAEGATATYAVLFEQSSVTPEAAERGGPQSGDDWSTEKSEGTLTCRVAKVVQVGDAQVSKVECTGFEFDGIGSPIDGYWVLGFSGLARVYGDEVDANTVRSAFGDDAIPLLPMAPRTGRRANEETEVVIATKGRALCATETAQMGDDSGTEVCFEQAAWPVSFKASGGAAWSNVTVALTRK